VRQWDDVSIESGSDESKVKSRTASLLDIPPVQVTEGRPDLTSILKDEADLTAGRMSVSVCGSQAVANAVKAGLGFAVAGPSRILKGGPSITLHVEAFGYA